MTSLDRIDRHILDVLQRDGRLPNNLLADQVALSPSACLRRVRALEQSGAIAGYVALVDPMTVGMGFTAYARVWLTGQDLETVEHFTSEVGRLPQIVECYLMAGDCDFLLRVVAADLADYRAFQVQHLTRIRGVQSVKTEIPMERIKQSTLLPL